MKPFFKNMALAGAIAAVFSTPVMAAVSASASLSNFTVTLYDLSPLDDIAPTITWTDADGYNLLYGNYTNATTSDSAGYGLTGQSANWGALGSANSSIANLSHATAVATIEASGLPMTPSGSMSASGSASATMSSGSTSFYAYASQPYYYYQGFVLSANTMAVFTGTASTQTTTTVGYDPLAPIQSEYASASVYLYVSGIGASGKGNQSAYDSASSYASYTAMYNYETGTFTYGPQSTSTVATVGAAFVNMSAGYLTGQMQLSVNAQGTTSIAAVPEPESSAMLLVGLGIIGTMARRRQSH